MTTEKTQIAPAEGKLGVLLVGLGAVSTTFVAGVHAVKRGLAKPFGSLTQMGTIRLGKRTDNKSPLVKNFVPLTPIDKLEFGAWDIFKDDAYESALNAGVLQNEHLEPLQEELRELKPWQGAFDPNFVKKLSGTYYKKAANKWDLVQQLTEDMQKFKEEKKVDRLNMIWCASTEAFRKPTAVHQTVEAFEKGLKSNDPEIAPSQMYAYAALKQRIPFANGAPNLTVDTPALLELALENRVPISGKDFKTGQTLMKTIIAPGLRARLLGVSGWFSTNILGNRDGEVLDDPENFKTKEESKLSVLDTILQPEIQPELYGNIYHKVRINYYPPRKDNKESWDNIDIFGWLGYPMQLKVNFLCRYSILAAPIVLDLILFMDLAKRAGMKGIQEWLSFYYKSPQVAKGLYPEHNIFIQQMKLKNTLRHLMGEDPITHLGLEYYE